MSYLPLKFKAVELTAYNDNLIRALAGIGMAEREIKSLEPCQVLVKMAAAPINPSDIAFIRGGYNIVKALPAVLGFEGEGTVVETGAEASYLMNKRVSCFIRESDEGTWAEYFTCRAADCIILKDRLEEDQGAGLSINPLTAAALFEMVRLKPGKAVVQSAAGGQVAEYLRKMADKTGIDVINIVRKQAVADVLRRNGAAHVFCSSDADFQVSIAGAITLLNATLAFDAVGGELAGIVFNALPPGSELVMYGALSGAQLSGINPMELIFKRKKITGFNLYDWIVQKSPTELGKITEDFQDMMIRGEIHNKVRDIFPLHQVADAVRKYIKSMSDGKILLKP
jgi:NADPH:quinone reductase-like Zn-dependent oxidoreductase